MEQFDKKQTVIELEKSLKIIFGNKIGTTFK